MLRPVEEELGPLSWPNNRAEDSLQVFILLSFGCFVPLSVLPFSPRTVLVMRGLHRDTLGLPAFQ